MNASLVCDKEKQTSQQLYMVISTYLSEGEAVR